MSEPKILDVLVVEDEAELRDVYETVLTMQGMRVATANNGMQALGHLSQRSPDVIILDVLMPEMNGLEFMRNFDAADHPHTKVIVNSNVSDLDVIGELMSLGAHEHVLKSDLTPNDLIDVIRRVHNG